MNKGKIAAGCLRGNPQLCQYMAVPLFYELLMKSLFGDCAYDHFVGWRSLKEWRDHLRQVARAVKVGVDINTVNTDTSHRAKLGTLCRILESGIKGSCSKDELNAHMMSSLLNLVFALLGDVPDHYKARKVSNPKQWGLAQHRTLTYTHTFVQQARLLLSAAHDNPSNTGWPSFRQLAQQFQGILRGDARKFVCWFRENYPSQYLEVF